MARKGKPSVKAQVEFEDGKIMALQADPECPEMKRMVADLNRRVLRLQSHGMASWGTERGKGRIRGFGVEVAREATEEEAAGAGSSASFYTAAEEPARQSDTALVQQYLEDVEEMEGKPGPVRKTITRWVYGKPAAGHADTCSCRQVEAVAGKMTIAEASGMRDEAVDRMLVNIYFNPPPKRGVGSKVLHRASEVSRRLSERVKSVARRMSHRHTEPRVGNSVLEGEEVEEVAGAERETVQLRPSRKKSRSPPDVGDEQAREAGSVSSRHSQRKTSLKQERAKSGSETAPRAVRASSEGVRFHSSRSSLPSSDERAGSSRDSKTSLKQGRSNSGSESAPREVRASSSGQRFHSTRSSRPSIDERSGSSRDSKTSQKQGRSKTGSETAPREVRASSEGVRFHSARSSVPSRDERAGSSRDQGKLQSSHNVGIYQVLLDGNEDNADESGPHYQLPKQTSFAPQVNNTNTNGRKENLQEDTSLSGDLNELRHFDRHNSISEGDQDIKILRMNMAEAELNSEKDKPHSESSDSCVCENEKSESSDRDSLNGKGTSTGGTHFEEARREHQTEGTELKPDLQLPESDQQQKQRRIVGSLDLFILNDSADFEWEPVPEFSEEEVLASQPIGGLELEEDFSQNSSEGEEVTEESEHLQENTQNAEQQVTVEPKHLEENIQNADKQVTIEPDHPEENIQNAEQQVTVEPEHLEVNIQNAEQQVTVEPEHVEENIQNAEQQVTVEPEHLEENIQNAEHQVPVEPEHLEENIEHVENVSMSTHTVRGGRRTI